MFNRMTCSQKKFEAFVACRCDEPETVEHNYLSQSLENEENDSFSLFRRNLKSILRRTYEDAKHICPSYFFRQNRVLSWFRIQQLKNTMRMKLPPNLSREKKWMGLAMFAVFSVQRNSEFVQHHPFNWNIDINEYEIQSSPMIPVQLLWSSPKIIFVNFISREVFQDHILDYLYVKFLTNTMRLQVEICGARLVYQHNVDGFIHTIVDCVLKNGQNPSQNYSHDILRYLLATYHKPTGRKVTVDQPETSTSTEKLPQERPLLDGCIQGRYESKFNAIIDGKEIPEFFIGRNMGSEATIRVPKTKNSSEYHVGVLVCAVVTINKLIEKLESIPQAQRGIKVLDLTCEFGVDSLELEPEHRYFFPAEVLLGQRKTSFIWLFFIPLSEFDVPWRCCNYFRSKVSSNEKLLDVQRCGLHLLRATDRKVVENLLNTIRNLATKTTS